MYRIAICDDVKSSAAEAAELLKKYAVCHDEMEYEADVFYTSMDLLDALEKKVYDIFLLDIYIDRINGIELARSIKACNEDANIIFMTSSNAFYKEAFRIQAVHYLEKPIFEEDFFEAMDRVCREPAEIHYLTFRESGEIHRVAADDIIYIESEDHYKRIVIQEKSFLIRSTMIALSEELKEPYFYVLGVKCIINLKRVLKITRKSRVIEDGRECSVPRGTYRSLSEMVLKYSF
jgi:DNA-binding LytR/AlgR family response regulator